MEKGLKWDSINDERTVQQFTLFSSSHTSASSGFALSADIRNICILSSTPYADQSERADLVFKSMTSVGQCGYY